MSAGRPVDTVEWPGPPVGARIVHDAAELAEHFGDRRAVHIYALADLDEPFWSASRWYRRDDAVVGLVGLPSGQGVACYSVSTRDPAGSLDLLVDLAPALPSGLLITAPAGLAAALAPVRPLVWDATLVRYELTDPSRLPATDERVVPLGRDDLDELVGLYETEPDAVFFLPHMLADGTYVGVRDGGRLVAAAGTHVLSATYGVAALGAVYTAPDVRGRGLGRAVTAAVTRRLLDRVPTIGLNVLTGNLPARHVYDSIGFAAILHYDEAELA